MDVRRWTPLTFLFPRRYVETGPIWAEFDLRTWAREEFHWTQDPWNGLRDFAKRPAETVEAGRGDCEDFALVAASWAVAHGRARVGIAFCWETPRPWPTHVIAFDDDAVYSSGRISETTVASWVDDSRYDFAVKRRVV